ncbi:MAG: hypothetical protein FWC23_09670 [Chitinispirillia bacterium]|nr:hypothetical protein [Chitinispirillia bacterium]MCL2269437.1 hypothetical protein [Chitinispirillia bacterium]
MTISVRRLAGVLAALAVSAAVMVGCDNGGGGPGNGGDGLVLNSGWAWVAKADQLGEVQDGITLSNRIALIFNSNGTVGAHVELSGGIWLGLDAMEGMGEIRYYERGENEMIIVNSAEECDWDGLCDTYYDTAQVTYTISGSSMTMVFSYEDCYYDSWTDEYDCEEVVQTVTLKQEKVDVSKTIGPLNPAFAGTWVSEATGAIWSFQTDETMPVGVAMHMTAAGTMEIYICGTTGNSLTLIPLNMMTGSLGNPKNVPYSLSGGTLTVSGVAYTFIGDDFELFKSKLSKKPKAPKLPKVLAGK